MHVSTLWASGPLILLSALISTSPAKLLSGSSLNADLQAVDGALRMSLSLPVHTFSSPSHASSTLITPALLKRKPHVISLANAWTVHYHVLWLFRPSWRTAKLLTSFWAQILAHALAASAEDLETATFAVQIGGLRLDIISRQDVDIPRELIMALADTMAAYTRKGFYGCFNARVSHGVGSEMVAVWISLRVMGRVSSPLDPWSPLYLDPHVRSKPPRPLNHPHPNPAIIASHRLVQLAASTITMGGGPDVKPEHLLAILPFPEPTEIIERIRKNYPHIEITYRRSILIDSPWNEEKDVPTELIHFFSAGTNHIAHHPIYTSTTIPLTTSSGIHGPQIAEWTILTALASSHHYSLLHSWQVDHNWGKSASGRAALVSLRDKAGQRLGVLGYGSIGRQVARVARALGMSVVAYTASPRETKESKRDKGFIVPGTGDPEGEIPEEWFSGLDKKSLHHFLAQDIDHLLISVPLTKQTTHFIGKEEFDILGRTKNAFVSNISRGRIIVQSDLIDALKRYKDNDPLDGGDGGGGLRGAALDVADPEPLPEDDPLWDAPNCIVTPHISGLGSAYEDRAFQVLEVNLERRERGERMINVVDREKGY